jgi:WD40 repeat protein
MRYFNYTNLRQCVKQLLICILFLSACVSQESNTGPGRNQPTVPPPPWQESVDTISLDNVQAIKYLGRLDTAGTPSTVFAYAVSPDSTRIAGLNNDQLLAWDLVTGNLLFATSRGEAVQVFYSPDKTELYTLDTIGTVTVYDAENGIVQNSFAGQENYNGVAVFHEDGWLALGSLSGQVRVWDTFERLALATFRTQQLQVTALAFSPDGTQLASAGDDPMVSVWNWRDRLSVGSFDNEEVSARRMAFTPDGAQLAVGTTARIRVWSLTDSALAHTLETGEGGVTEVLLYSPDGEYLVNGGGIPELTLWDAQTGELLTQLPGVGGDRTSAAFSPDGNLLATSVLGGAATLWDMTQITSATLQRADLDVRSNQVLFVYWTPDSRLLLLFDALGPIYVWGIGAGG